MSAVTVTKNSCRLCMPLGASLAFKGIEGSMTLLHGGQGCATYIRRYMIGHFREPVDIGSSSFTEETAVFGGKANLFTSLDTIISRYHPKVIGIATTCVSETIGEDLGMYLHEYKVLHKDENLPLLVEVSTPSYEAYHGEGYWRSVVGTLKALGEKTDFAENLTIFPGPVSPGDLREMKSWLKELAIPLILFPDYSESLDGGPWTDYEPVPKGGTPVEKIQAIPNSSLCIEFSGSKREKISPVSYIEDTWRIPSIQLPLPVGVRLTDHFFSVIEKFFGKELPEEYSMERQRLIDLYVDGHKLAYGKKFALYGDEDTVASMASFLCEAGFTPALIAANSSGGNIQESLSEICEAKHLDDCVVLDNPDFGTIENEVKKLHADGDIDFLIGNSKGYKIARSIQKPLIRIGFPVHDRIGSGHLTIVGYAGASRLYTEIINTLLNEEQEHNMFQYGNY